MSWTSGPSFGGADHPEEPFEHDGTAMLDACSNGAEFADVLTAMFSELGTLLAEPFDPMPDLGKKLESAEEDGWEE